MWFKVIVDGVEESRQDIHRIVVAHVDDSETRIEQEDFVCGFRCEPVMIDHPPNKGRPSGEFTLTLIRQSGEQPVHKGRRVDVYGSDNRPQLLSSKYTFAVLDSSKLREAIQTEGE